MVMYVFRGCDGRAAVRRALDFWYRRMRSRLSLMEFLGFCRRGSGENANGETVHYVVYRGPAPAARSGISAQTRKDAITQKKDE